MKNVFGYKVENKKISEFFDGDCFVTERLDSAREKEIEEKFNSFDKDNPKFRIPIWVTVIKFLSWFVGLAAIIFIIIILENYKTSLLYKNLSYFYFISGLFLFISLILTIIEQIKKCKYLKNEKNGNTQNDFEKIYKEVLESVGVPDNAIKLDIMSYEYKEKNSSIKIIKFLSTYYFNEERYIFINNNMLCFADIVNIVCIPLPSIKGLKKFSGNVKTFGWNKEEDIKSGEYEKYKLKQNKFGKLLINAYYVLKIDDPKGEFEIFIPEYDIDKLTSLVEIDIIE